MMWWSACKILVSYYSHKGESKTDGADRIGTDTYIDYRTTISSFSTSILEYNLPKVSCILLECIEFIQPIIPEGYVVPTIEEVRASRFDDTNDDMAPKAKKRKISIIEPTPLANGTSHGVNGSVAVSPSVPATANGHVSPVATSITSRPDIPSASTANPIGQGRTSPANTPSIVPNTAAPPLPSLASGAFPSVLAQGNQGPSSITVNRPPVPQWAVNAMNGQINAGDAWSSDVPLDRGRSRTHSGSAKGSTRSDPADGASGVGPRIGMGTPRDGLGVVHAVHSNGSG